MYVLGIETSCDETGAAVVRDGRSVLSNIVSSSLKFHQKYGGIIPEIAFRMQLETITGVADCALKDAGIKLKEIKLISVTAEPGLLGSLLVGMSFARSVQLALNIPVLEVNHLYSHIYANFLNAKPIPLPFVALIVSGGHTSLFYLNGFNRITLLGSTQDDACGEAFDKVAKILGLGYPGGPFIERLSQKGNPKKIIFKCSQTKEPLNFSFSGIKTAVLYYAKKHLGQKKDYRLTCDIAAAFQEAAIDALIRKSLLACRLKKAKRLVIGGGVAVNNRLRQKFIQKANEEGLKIYFPSRDLCLDNAAMVAGLGYRLFREVRYGN